MQLGPSYRKLVRLAVRAFHDEPLRAKDDDGQRLKSMKYETKGLAIFVIDALTRHEWVNEADLSAELRLHTGLLKRVLRQLEGDRYVMREQRRVRMKKEGGQIQEETRSFVAIDYPLFVDVLQLRLHLTRKRMSDELDTKDKAVTYVCPVCAQAANPFARQKARHTEFDILSLLDPFTGRIRCPTCSTDLREDDGSAGDGDGGRQRAERRKKLKDLLHRFDAQLKPLTDLLQQLKDVAPPDYGTLEQWAMNKRLEAERMGSLAGPGAAAASGIGGRGGQGVGGGAGGDGGNRAAGAGRGETYTLVTSNADGRSNAVTIQFAIDDPKPGGPQSPAPEKKQKTIAPWHARSAAAPSSGPGALDAAGPSDHDVRVKTEAELDEERHQAYIRQYLDEMRRQQEQQQEAEAEAEASRGRVKGEEGGEVGALPTIAFSLTGDTIVAPIALAKAPAAPAAAAAAAAKGQEEEAGGDDFEWEEA